MRRLLRPIPLLPFLVPALVGLLAASSAAIAEPSQRVGRIGPETQRPYDWKDEAAALEALHVALTEAGDGSTYIWYRQGGRLSGAVQPTQSFEDVSGRICRHIVVTLSDSGRSAKTEGIACRLVSGEWQLDG